MIIVGVLLSTLASCMNATGLNLQRLAGTIGPGGRCAPGLLNALGIALSTGCGLVDMASYGFAPQSMLAPLGAVTLVVNLLLAPVMHGETLRAADAVYTCVIVAGIVLCISSGSSEGGGDSSSSSSSSSSSATPSIESVADLYVLAAARRSLSVLAAAAAILLGVTYHIYAAEAAGRGALLSTGFGYPIIAGMFGGATVLSAKILTTVLELGSGPAVVAPIIALVASCAGLQIVVNNRGLAKHSPLVLVPIYSSTFVLSNAIGGGVFWKEFDGFSAQQWQGYGAGVACVVGGVLLIARAAVATQEKAKKK
jgi:hypothetical protein